MALLHILESKVQTSRRELFSIAGVGGCLTCTRALLCAQPPPAGATQYNPSEKADLTWEQLFRFAYQKDLIPLLKQMADRIGREKFCELIRESSDAVVRTKSAGRPPVVKDLESFAANLRNPPPLIRNALEAEIVESNAEAFEYSVKKCLWARMFLESQAGDIGYAMVCYPDYSVARSLHPKLKLVRHNTIMQGADRCDLRYVMEG